MSDTQQRLNRARVALEGLSVGDAFGECFFQAPHAAIERLIPEGRWPFTDDTNMALSIYAILREYGEINQDALARHFARYYHPLRGYGRAMHGVMEMIKRGVPWSTIAPSLFDGTGSFGNGAAMRIGPLGAYFADAGLETVAQQARLASEVTHAHPEGIAGGIAVALAVAVATQQHDQPPLEFTAFIDRVLTYVPESFVRQGILKARELPADTGLHTVVNTLGNGSAISAQDTVAFTLWSAGHHISNYEEAIWTTIQALGDIDTTAAIVGGIVASYTGVDAIPALWKERREQLPDWAFEG